MMKWELLTDEEARRVWDVNLIRFAEYSPFQMFAWGEYNRKLGWEPCYFAIFDNQRNATAMCLGLLRRYPLGSGLMWCAGGPVGDIKTWNSDFQQTIQETTKLKRLYLRFRIERERNTRDVLFLNQQKWARSVYTMTSGLTMELDLAQNDEKMLAQLSSKWRRNLKVADKNELRFELTLEPDIKQLCAVYEEMETRKNLPQLFSPEKLQNLFKQLKSNLIFYQCKDANGNLLCFRAALVAGNRACDYLAATTEQGRKLLASYPTLRQLLEHCRKQGVRYYDLGGIDPWANPGVYQFKKGTGAREVELLGEWDWATSPSMHRLGNLAIQQKQNIKRAQFISLSPLSLIKSLSKIFKYSSTKLSPKAQYTAD
jgi:lipid II:glycine glycyltransferase (peptidoglycan interpeptide bridge formation enzyme)